MNSERKAFDAWFDESSGFTEYESGLCWEAWLARSAFGVTRETVIEWLDALNIEVTDRQLDGLFSFATPATFEYRSLYPGSEWTACDEQDAHVYRAKPHRFEVRETGGQS